MLAQDREILHRLLTHFHPESYEDYFKHFEEGLRVHLSKIQPMPTPLHLKLDDLHALFHKIHYSWYVSPLEKLPKEILSHALALFSGPQHVGLSKLEFYVKPSRDPSKALNLFYFKFFLKELGYETLVPLSFLPASRSQRFLKYNKNQLLQLIQHLGILELASLSKKVVDKKVLTRIDQFLPPKQAGLYRQAKRFSEPRAAALGSLDQSLESEESFSRFIDKRGIERLSRGIVMEHPTLIWHIAHHLDQSRGQELLLQSRRGLPSPYTPFFTKQVHEISDTLEAS